MSTRVEEALQEQDKVGRQAVPVDQQEPIARDVGVGHDQAREGEDSAVQKG